MKRRRDQDDAAVVALEAVRAQHMVAQLSRRYGVHTSESNTWNAQFLDWAARFFGEGPDISSTGGTTLTWSQSPETSRPAEKLPTASVRSQGAGIPPRRREP